MGELTAGQRVVVQSNGSSWPGEVRSIDPDTATAYVRLDTGTRCTFPLAQLAAEEVAA